MTCWSCSPKRDLQFFRADTKSWEFAARGRECSEPAGVQVSEIRCRIAESGQQEKCMNKFAIRLLPLALLSLTLVAAPVVTVVYAAPDNDPPPPDKGKKKKSSEVQPGTQQTAFADGYRAAYATIYDRHDYASAIEQLKALGRDDSAAVANLIGYYYRKLGDYKVSQIWYERALKADPNHVKTWQYYGLWQVEQGNREQAQ